MSTLKAIPLDAILDNEFRDFKLYPIDKVGEGNQVDELVESYKEVGDFGAIPVRPLGGGKYEQAAGHHRKAALVKMGETHANCIVDDYSDDDMVRIMVLENSKQQGNNSPAALDSLAACTRVVAYYLMTSDTAEEFSELCGWDGLAPGLSEHGYKVAKGQVENGKGVSHVCLTAFSVNGLGERRETSKLNNVLMSSGNLAEIYKEVADRVEAEMAEKEEAERAAEAARKKAQAKADREAAAARKAMEVAKAAAAKAKASEKKAAQARAEQAARDSVKKAKLRKIEMERQEKERAKIEANKEARAAEKLRDQARVDAAKKAQLEAAELGKGLHPEMLSLIKTASHIAAFRNLVTTDEGKEAIPMSQHPAIWHSLVEDAGNEEVTGKFIGAYLRTIFASRNAEMRRMKENEEKAKAKASVRNKVARVTNEFSKNVGNVSYNLLQLVELLDDEATGEYTLQEIWDHPKLYGQIESLERMLIGIRQSIKLRETWKAKEAPIKDVG